MMRFDWDEAKAARNLAKHGVSFQEAGTIFRDTLGWTYPDVLHSEFEQRWITVGMSDERRILVVAHTAKGETIRIINARVATRKERRFYEEG
jgi:uncharacterized protein